MSFNDPEYKKMLSLMPRSVLLEYAETLETAIGNLIYEGSGPDCVPEMTLERIEDEFG